MDRQEYWDKCIVIGPDIRRFVAQVDLTPARTEEVETEDRYGKGIKQVQIDAGKKFRMFEPSHPEQDFNIVLSLCTDGTHRPLFDLDYPLSDMNTSERRGRTQTYLIFEGSNKLILDLQGTTVMVPSTSHRHAYNNMALSFEEYVKLLKKLPGKDAENYRYCVESQGYGGLRPPWVKKEGSVPKVSNETSSVQVPEDFIFPPGIKKGM